MALQIAEYLEDSPFISGRSEWWPAVSSTSIVGSYRSDATVSLYDEDAMDWSPQISLGSNYFDRSVDIELETDQDLSDRIALIAKKYATDSLELNREDDARLQILNQIADLKYFRYSEDHWSLLKESYELVNELLEQPEK